MCLVAVYFCGIFHVTIHMIYPLGMWKSIQKTNVPKKKKNFFKFYKKHIKMLLHKKAVFKIIFHAFLNAKKHCVKAPLRNYTVTISSMIYCDQ